MLKIFLKVNLKSLRYQFVILIITVIIGIGFMIMAINMLKASKLEDADFTLDAFGNYDMAFCDVKPDLKKTIYKDKDIGRIGEVYDYGYVQINGKKALLGAVKNKKSERMLYLNPVKGRYPVRQNEICIDETFLRSLGIKKSIGDYVDLKFLNKNTLSAYKIVGVIDAVRIDGGVTVAKRRYYYNTEKMLYPDMKYEDFPIAYVYPGKEVKKKNIYL